MKSIVKWKTYKFAITLNGTWNQDYYSRRKPLCIVAFDKFMYCLRFMISSHFTERVEIESDRSN